MMSPVVSRDEVWALTPTGTWYRSEGASSFAQLATHRPRTRRYTAANKAVAIAGGAVGLIGGGLAAFYYANAAAAAQEAGEATVWSAYESAQADHKSAEGRFQLTASIAGGGLVVGVFGASFPMGRVVPRSKS